MVVINLGYTAPVNRPGQQPVLTLQQVWEGLQHKMRRADKFVPIITACEVLAEEEPSSPADGGPRAVVTRRVTFQPDTGPWGKSTVVEVCRLYPPCRIDFVQEDGATIGNYVTQGPSGDPADLLMTYVFQWNVPQVAEGSAEAKELEEKYRKVRFVDGLVSRVICCGC
ncbi:uncharacterized protein THITE_2116400 [Thermothielavioides terrestris NRRL 8126]|uniref:DUF1857-domain-containing protein n=1 Tax=Thermothielavioides terrestris (strain ATCC 38088 / NRRL 8126) TaxID=578455 RepID=G2R5S0_THETT|nr:uncharacterized protein THITE_2116400 [Thermothielavioides terrestris NRRL 8126]AEO67509.1 hypothetical protein THITE_2116400 [Thermothielavioides terrestris NRRL 8126]